MLFVDLPKVMVDLAFCLSLAPYFIRRDFSKMEMGLSKVLRHMAYVGHQSSLT